MPTPNPRLTITLRPQLAAVLRRLSELTGNSQSAMIGELLADSLPIFERMVEVLGAAEKLREQAMEAPSEVTRSLDRAQARIEAQLGLVLDDMGEGFRPLLEQAEKVQRRGARTAGSRPSAARGAALTPPSNRGVRSPTPPRKGAGSGKKKRRGPGE
jgi:hypothetical protein